MKIALRVNAPLGWIKSRLERDQHYQAEIQERRGNTFVFLAKDFHRLADAAKSRGQLIKDFEDMGGEPEIRIDRHDWEEPITLFEYAAAENEGRLQAEGSLFNLFYNRPDSDDGADEALKHRL